MAFIDEVTIQVYAGRGGDGVVRWKREKNRPKAGPGGGDGGRGGDFSIEAIADLSYLENYRFIKKLQAQHGKPGGNFGVDGSAGEEHVLKVPIGSIVTNVETGEFFEFMKVGQKIQLLKGGKGGYGNIHFKASTNITPMEWTPGKLGGNAKFRIELRLIADVGVIGLPNAGKSSLLGELTSSRSRIGAYQFTTLEPHLGVMEGEIVLADVPGLIEGASEGKGLGHKFLKHITRTKVLIHMVSCENKNVVEAYRQIRKELGSYDHTLLEKKELVVLSKTDEVSPEEAAKKRADLQQEVKRSEVTTLSLLEDGSIGPLTKQIRKLAA